LTVNAAAVDRCLKGAYDLHIHTGPSLFKRGLDDFEMAEKALNVKMKGFLIKAHEGSTVSRAYLAKKYFKNRVNIIGGHVMNIQAGGFNPYVVDAQIKLGAKVIWFPTISAANHIKHFGSLQYGAMKSTHALMEVQEGLTINDDKGVLLPDVVKILELIAEADVCLSTGHLSNEEIFILCRKAYETGVKKIIVNHPDFETNRMAVGDQQKLAQLGVYLEKSLLCLHPSWKSIDPEEMVEGINQIGAEKCILTTDYGQVENPDPVEGMKHFIRTLLKLDLAQNKIALMLKDNPYKLINARSKTI